MKKLRQVFVFLLGTFLSSLSSAVDTYVGTQACMQCHQEEAALWKQSHHAKSMQEASAESVLGDFSDNGVSFHGIESRFFKKNDEFYVETLDGAGERRVFKIKYTFGFQPLQQYLLELEGGRLQAFNVAWDSRPESKGGQRWFHLQPAEDLTPQHPFYWTRYFQNWNSRCADCHSTNVQINYDADSNSYATQYTEPNVACESCHGPGNRHIELVNAGKIGEGGSGFEPTVTPAFSWENHLNQGIANPVLLTRTAPNEIDMCGACHSLRQKLTNKKSSGNYHDRFSISLLSQPNYHFDGQIRGEVFVLGSFLQSKMHEQGVTCSDCHDPHSGAIRGEGNGVCTQCHVPETYDSPEHHQHQTDSAGAQCAECHMPSTTYMQVDPRRDHSFSIPSTSGASPNACLKCHVDQYDNSEWLISALAAFGDRAGGDVWSEINRRVQSQDILVTRSLTDMVLNQDLAAIRKASLMTHLAMLPSRLSAQTAQKLLEDPNPMVRRGAVSALVAIPPQAKWAALKPHLKDKRLSVRLELARTLADVLPNLPPQEQSKLEPVIQEYRAYLDLQQDSPAGLLELASLELALRDLNAAERAILRALMIEPNFVPAMVNLADIYRAKSDFRREEDMLKRAISIAPDSGAAQHSFGLHLIRKKDYPGSLQHLKLATAQTDAAPRYAYVYAVALHGQGRTGEAIQVLQDADEKWPNQLKSLVALADYLEKEQRIAEFMTVLSRLTAIAPNAPIVKTWVSRYAQ